MYGFQILKYYSQPHVQEKMIEVSRDREVVGTLLDGTFSRRPDVLIYKKDIEEKVKQGIVAFHCSVERWKQPLQVSADFSREHLDGMRKGWDFILDMDAKTDGKKGIEHAKIAAAVVCELLKDYGVTPTIKFSGSRGFHIAVAQEAFPEKLNLVETRVQYPEIPQTITNFIREKIKDMLLDELIKKEGGVSALAKTVPSLSELSPYAFVEFEKEWGSRHMFRMPYSLHAKTWLVSLPIRQKDLKDFSPENAKPFSFKTDADFLKSKEGEASDLLTQALDWHSKQKISMTTNAAKPARKFSVKSPISEEHFPPCIKLVLAGLQDGRKRSIFTLATFLQTMNWPEDDIEEALKEWNKKNKPPLRDNSIRTQLKWHLRQSRKILPANCDSELFYKSIGVCRPDSICTGGTDKIIIKNPVNHAFKSLGIKVKRFKSDKTRKKHNMLEINNRTSSW